MKKEGVSRGPRIEKEGGSIDAAEEDLSDA